MIASRLHDLANIGVDQMGTLADRAENKMLLRLENLDTDLRPPPGVVEATRQEVELDRANSYLPFLGSNELREAAAALVSQLSAEHYDWNHSTIICEGGLNDILTVLLSLLETSHEGLMTDPMY